jgi:hypothetical protein
VVNHPEFGWLAFGGNVTMAAGRVHVQVLDSFRKRVYIAPLGLYLTLDRGAFESVAINPKTNAVQIRLAPADALASSALLRIEQPATVKGIGKYRTVRQFGAERGGWSVPLGKTPTVVELIARQQ